MMYIPSAVPFFIFGFIYYLVIPYLGITYLYDNILIEKALPFIDKDFFNLYYFLDLFIILFSWLFGYFMIQKIKLTKNIPIIDKISIAKISPKIIFSILLSLFFIFLSKALMMGNLFSGYDTYDITIIGPIATLVFMSAFFINFFGSNKITKYFFILFIMSSILLLSYGSRMFFLLGIISLLLGIISKNPSLLKSKKLYFFIFFIFILILYLGIWRSSGEFSFELLLSIFIIEPIFTLTSAGTYFENIGTRPVFGYPSDILAAFINFIPSILFPSKLELINNLTFNKNIYTPFGASSLLANIYVNFGIFFPLYFILIGIFTGYLKKRAYNSLFFRASYLSILPVFMFHFYREGFITVIKVIFFNALVLPFILLLYIYIIMYRKKNV